MKTVKLLFIMSIALCSSCQEQDLVYDSSIDSEDIIDVRMDSLLIYQKQINHGEMLNNLIRYRNGKFYLDLSAVDAEKLGISLSEYDNVLKQVELLNNKNFKVK